MRIQYIATPKRGTLLIKTCILKAFVHDRVVPAALKVAPDAEVTHTGLFVIRTFISGDPALIYAATRAARREEEI